MRHDRGDGVLRSTDIEASVLVRGREPQRMAPRLASLESCVDRFAWMALTLGALALAQTGVARAQGTGRSLDIQPGARQNAMGAAGAALLDDPSAGVWWNPAILGFARRPDGQWSTARLVPGLASDVFYVHATALCPIARIAAVGIGYTELDYPQSYGDYSDGSVEGFGDREQTVSASAGVAVLPNLSLGATAKWIRIAFRAPLSGRTRGYDAGALYRVVVDSLTLSLGVNVQNLGPPLALPHGFGSSPLTRNLKAGVAVQFPMHLAHRRELGITAVLDHNRTLLVHDHYQTWNVGLEVYGGVRGRARLSLRAGYMDDPHERLWGATYGAGVRLAWLTLDAGFIPQAGTTHLDPIRKITMGYHFDPSWK